jgi:hypothetical protein
MRLSFFALLSCLLLWAVGCSSSDEEAQTPKIPDSPADTTKYDNYQAFNSVFHNGSKQGNEVTVTLPANTDKYSRIWMYVNLRCPNNDCGDWDVYANIYVKDTETNTFLEIARYITPYGVDNAKRERGFKFDVTDFKSLLKGSTTLKSYIECWTADGWDLSVDFDYEQGVPDYKYYAVSPIVQMNRLSIEGIPYGTNATYNPKKNITIPSNALKTHLRTIITGWGHATPTSGDGRPCAEWCFRTHNVQINGENTFQHKMQGIGCSSNPVSPQGGNWSPDRAGWCPGMEVPTRIDVWSDAGAGTTKEFKYVFQPWTNDGLASNPNAYYAISTMVVVKSNTPITKPIVTD